MTVKEFKAHVNTMSWTCPASCRMDVDDLIIWRGDSGWVVFDGPGRLYICMTVNDLIKKVRDLAPAFLTA